MAKSRAFVFTINNYNDEDEQLLHDLGRRADESRISYLVVGREIAPTTGTPHLQGYIRFINPRSRAATSRLLGGRAFVEPARGSQLQNSTYCKKSEDFFEYGESDENSVSEQGRRTDLERVRELLTTGRSFRDIALTCTSAQSFNFALRAAPYLAPSTRTKPTVIWIHGRSGTGKTHHGLSMAEQRGYDTYIHSTGKWFDGYDSQQCVILDDIRTDTLPFAFLLRLLDKFPVRVESKGSSTWFNPLLIVVTCPHSPSAFTPEGEESYQLTRRITETYEFTEVYRETEVRREDVFDDNMYGVRQEENESEFDLGLVDIPATEPFYMS